MPAHDSLEKWSNFWYALVKRLPADLIRETRYSECHKRLVHWRELLATVPKHGARFCGWLKANQLEHKTPWILACHFVQLQSPACVAVLADPHAVIPDAKAGEACRPEWTWIADTLPQIRSSCMTLARGLEKESDLRKITRRSQRRKPRRPAGKVVETTEKLSDWQVRMLQQKLKASEEDDEDLGPDPFERIDFEPLALQEHQRPLSECQQVNTLYHYPVILVGRLSSFLEEALTPYEPVPFIRGYWKLQNALLFCSASNSWDAAVQGCAAELRAHYTLLLTPKYRYKRWYWLAIPSQVPSTTIKDWSPLDPDQLAQGRAYG